MSNHRNVIDICFERMEEVYLKKISDEFFGTKYKIVEDLGEGTVTRVIVDNGLKVAYSDAACIVEWTFNNKEEDSGIIEIIYCYEGNVKIDSIPDGEIYLLKKGDIAFYKYNNNIEKFTFSYDKYFGISIQVDLNQIKQSINPVFNNEIILEWESLINKIFENQILNIEQAPYNIKLAAEAMRNMKLNNMIDYIRIKFKALELFMLSIQFKRDKYENIKKYTVQEINLIYNAEKIILDNLENTPSLEQLSSQLNISIYKLQKCFKEILGSTVYEYIKKARIEKSKIYLKNTDMPVICIANQIGYENPSKFANAFKSCTGITPSEYRKYEK